MGDFIPTPLDRVAADSVEERLAYFEQQLAIFNESVESNLLRPLRLTIATLRGEAEPAPPPHVAPPPDRPRRMVTKLTESGHGVEHWEDGMPHAHSTCADSGCLPVDDSGQP